MIENKFPDGWNEDRVRKVIAYYQGQSEDEALGEHDSETATETLMSIPHDLVPKVRELIAKRQG